MADGYGAGGGGPRVNAHVVVVGTPDIMRQFVTQNPSNLSVTPEPVVQVGTYAEFNRLTLVRVQTQ